MNDILNSNLKLLRKNQPFLSKEFGVEKIGVFGSVTKGEATKDSDIDIVVKLKEPLGFKFIDLTEYLEKLFNRKVDVLTEAGINNIRIKKVTSDIKRNIVYV